MFQAFNNWRSAARFDGLLLLLLLLPLILDAIGLPSRAEVYNGLRVGGGPYVKTRQQLFGTSGDVDIAFVGSSILNMAVDVDALQARFEERFGSGANVRMFGFVFQGFDMQYVMLRDLLEHRQVKVVVTSFSGPRQLNDLPHVQLHNVLRHGEYPEIYQGLSFRHRIALYGSHVLDGPRQLLKVVRPERPIDAADQKRSFISYEATQTDSHGSPAPPVVLSSGTRGEFVFGGPGLSDRQRHFATRVAELAAQHHVKLIILNLPTPDDFSHDGIWERSDWTQLLAGPPCVVGFRRTDLFGAGPASQFFSDSVHLNADGQKRFTQALIPFLVTTYANHSSC